jgi:hypothetical protein
MIQLLCTSLLVLVAICFFGSAIRHAQAIKAADVYLHNFSELTDNENVPVSILETLHKGFKSACHPCATLYLATSVIRYRYDADFRAKVENQEKPKHLENLDRATASKLSATVVSLYLYASYSVPILGMLIRPLIFKTAQKSQSEDRKVVSEKAKFFMFNAEHSVRA